jgi:hypothetical protein
MSVEEAVCSIAFRGFLRLIEAKNNSRMPKMNLKTNVLTFYKNLLRECSTC